MSVAVKSGVDRFVEDQRRVFDLDELYSPYPMQANFHRSRAKHNLLGGAAGPGKTLALIMEHLVACNEFENPDDARQVHTLLLRRTHPQLEATLITRFKEKIPKELYSKFNETHKVCTWLNGATTQFGSMQYENDAYGWQGQWYKIGFDELTEFTFRQWQAISAWNRCPVSPYATKDGATNPIGVGAQWVQALFVDHKPCDEMDTHQAGKYNPADYAYFPCTYLDNPIYANDQKYIAALESYDASTSRALKEGVWGLGSGGYFQGAWDKAVNVYPAGSVPIQPWNKRWLSGDWGFEHWAAIYKHFMDDDGLLRTYGELCVKHQPPEELAESIAKFAYDEDGTLPEFKAFFFSHDAFASKATATMGSNANSVAFRMASILRAAGVPQPVPSTRDKVGREQLMYQLLTKRMIVGEAANGMPIEYPAWQIADCCTKLIQVIPTAPRDDVDREKIAEFPGDDPLQGSGYGIYGILGKPGAKPHDVVIGEAIANATDPTQKHILHLKAEEKWKREHGPIRIRKNWRRGPM